MRISDWSSDVCSSDLPATLEVCRCLQHHHDVDIAEFVPECLLEIDCTSHPMGVQEHLIATRGQRIEQLKRRGSSFVADRKSVVEGKSVSVRVDLGGRRIIQKKKR